jgi:acetyltransferase
LPTELATSRGEAARIAADMGFPVVMKIVSPQILHKSDAGGVKIGLEDADAVKAAFDRITENAGKFDPNAEITGVLVQKMAPKGREVIVGANRYPVFGPLLMFGYGGIFVEVFKDVAFRLAPIGRNEARRMVRDIKGYKLLSGFRGEPPSDTDILERLMVCLSDMTINHPEIKEMDINPLLVHEKGKGATVADCRILLERPETEEPETEE